MVYIPQERMIPVVPDLADLPVTIRLPRNRRWPFVVVVISGVWMIFGAFAGLWMPLFWPTLSLAMQVAISFALTSAAVFAGIFALRLYASEDEVTISATGVDQRIFQWLGCRRKSLSWSDIDAIKQSNSDGFEVLELIPSNAEALPIAVFISKKLSQASRTKLALEALKAAAN